ncbi:MAG TPA: class I SAM-dependent methyltransferase [Nitriliruptorales bacterium]
MCGGYDGQRRFRADTTGTEGGVDPHVFRPSSDRFGATAGTIVRCRRCGHGSLDEVPPAAVVAAAYGEAADPVSLREEEGQSETARRALRLVEQHAGPGRMADIGCWTGSFLAAARERGWEGVGIEPSTWAVARARERGLNVRRGSLDDHGLLPNELDLVVLTDVLEHLADPAAAVDEVRRLLRPGGALYLTVPDAGSVAARTLGRRWWSVLPMHLQYFTRDSLRLLLTRHGFLVRRVASHPKVFTARYYAERLDAFLPGDAPVVSRAVGRLGWHGRLIAPDLRDRVQVVATRSP